ncbi:MAG: NfeD family protein [Deltaproteobacteria bacterium]|nr:NfeD family protein [Deltaproteobacteria bacterium]
MGADFLMWMWLGVGVVLIAAEFALPGLVSVFGGIAALVVAALSFVGVTESLPAQLITWMVLSVGMVVTLRKAARQYFQGDVIHADIDEARMHYGKTVEVVEDLSDEKEGRIRYQGSTWTAISTGVSLKKGDQARLVFQDNLTWVVERIDAKNEGSGDVKGALTEGSAKELKVPQNVEQTHR